MQSGQKQLVHLLPNTEWHTNRRADACTPWLCVEWLPSYAANLIPVEAMWSYAKFTAPANVVPDDREQLEDAVIEAVS